MVAPIPPLGDTPMWHKRLWRPFAIIWSRFPKFSFYCQSSILFISSVLKSISEFTNAGVSLINETCMKLKVLKLQKILPINE